MQLRRRIDGVSKLLGHSADWKELLHREIQQHLLQKFGGVEGCLPWTVDLHGAGDAPTSWWRSRLRFLRCCQYLVVHFIRRASETVAHLCSSGVAVSPCLALRLRHDGRSRSAAQLYCFEDGEIQGIEIQDCVEEEEEEESEEGAEQCQGSSGRTDAASRAPRDAVKQ